jgi:hypothetical protein
LFKNLKLSSTNPSLDDAQWLIRQETASKPRHHPAPHEIAPAVVHRPRGKSTLTLFSQRAPAPLTRDEFTDQECSEEADIAAS